VKAMRAVAGFKCQIGSGWIDSDRHDDRTFGLVSI
jgi:hypothetical protein